jgi:nucleoid DNA-binding protein
MNKIQLAEELSKKSGINKKEALDIIDAFTVTIKDSLKRGDKVIISGLGTFMNLKRKGYLGKNAVTGEPLEVPEVIFPYFKASNILKESLK